MVMLCLFIQPVREINLLANTLIVGNAKGNPRAPDGLVASVALCFDLVFSVVSLELVCSRSFGSPHSLFSLSLFLATAILQLRNI